MTATLKSGIGQALKVVISEDTRAKMSKQSVQEAIQTLLAEVEGPKPVTLSQATSDPRSVIEIKTKQGYQPLDNRGPMGSVLQDNPNPEILINPSHAGG